MVLPALSKTRTPLSRLESAGTTEDSTFGCHVWTKVNEIDAGPGGSGVHGRSFEPKKLKLPRGFGTRRDSRLADSCSRLYCHVSREL